MNLYVVGGAVRDRLLGKTPKDLDYVVVGETPETMINLGFTKVGADFPVFLHPESGDEYALARTERSTGIGYNDFETDYNPKVTLEDDLARRDLTVNAMAVPVAFWDHDDWQDYIIDPHNGLDDIKAQILRHTTEAFKEDPLRILRVARFSARYGWEVDHSTYSLMMGMRDMVYPTFYLEEGGLVPERVWAELSRAMMEPYAWKFFEVLENCALERVVFPHFNLNRILDDTYMVSFLPCEELGRAVKNNLSLEQRYAMVASDLSQDQHTEMKVPLDCSKMALAVGELINDIIGLDFKEQPEDVVRIIHRLKMRQDIQFAADVFTTIDAMLFTGESVDDCFRASHEVTWEWLKDVNIQMKNMDYDAIVQKAKADKESVRDAVKNAEIACAVEYHEMRLRGWKARMAMSL